MKIDYKSFSSDGSEDSRANTDKRWWLSNKTDIANSISGVISTLVQFDSKRQSQYQISTRLYGNLNLSGVNGLSASKNASSPGTIKERVSYNVIQSVIDTITAKIAKNKPKPLFLTSGGDYKIQRRAKKLDKFVDGTFYENDAYVLGRTVFRDACIFGDGFIHVFEHNGRVKYERVLSSELFTDPLEAFYGNPRQLHRVKNIDRAVLADLFPQFKRSIMEANAANVDLTGIYQNVSDQITVRESWHLPSGPEAKDGLHVISIDGKELLVEDWDNDFFPFAKFGWSQAVNGYWSQSLASQIQNIQIEINKLLWVIQRSMHMAGTFKIFMENSSKIVKEHFTNDIGSIITYTGTPPQYVTPPAVQMEFYQHFQTLKNSAYEQAGVSQLSASAQKPAGLNSGKALREYNDIESDRFMTVGQGYEQMFLDLAKLTIWKAKEIYEREGEYKVTSPQKKFCESIDWSDVDLADDEYVMQIFPVSKLPSDPAGRLQTIQEYAQAGFLTPRQARKLLDFPDLEQVETASQAQDDYLHMILDKLLDKGEYTPPEPQDDLDLARELALEYYSQGKLNNLEEEKLELLRTFIEQINFLQAKAMPPAPPPMLEAPAGPEARPVSDMLPNVPLQ